jgi:hypothetical protein
MESHKVNRQSNFARKCHIEDSNTAARRAVAQEDRALSAVSQIRTQFAAMKAELEESRYMIAILQSDLRCKRAKQRTVNELPVAALRRQIAFRLHPDRGGDGETMARLNALFDLIESLQDDQNVNLAA